MPVLRVNLMWKCYLIGCQLQTTHSPVENLCMLRAMIECRKEDMCLFHVSFQNRFGPDRVPAHDEFTGARKVSPLDRAMRMSGSIRLRRTAAPGAIGIWALRLI